MGRPSKLDDLVAKRIVDLTAKGLPRNTVAKGAGIDDATLYRWLQRGADGEPGYREFCDRVRAAERKGEERLVEIMETHAEKHWQACAWLMERRNPEAFHKPGGDSAVLSESDARDLTADHVEAIARAMRSA